MNIWRWTALGGVLVFLFMMMFPAIAGLHACGGPADPIVALELARTPAEVAALFPAPCRAELVAAQMQGLRIDTFGFIPVYAGFLIASAIAAKGIAAPMARRLAGPAVALTLLAAGSDLVENGRMHAIVSNLPGTPAQIGVLMIASRAKFVLLGLALMLIGILHANSRGWPRWLGWAIALGGPLCAFGALFNAPLLPLGASLAWFSLLIVTVARAVHAPARSGLLAR